MKGLAVFDLARAIGRPADARSGGVVRRWRRSSIVAGVGGRVAWLPLLACGAGAVGATDADLARAREVTSRGAVVFVHDCASCHGRHGEGLAEAPPILGPRALPEYPRERPPTGVQGVLDPQLMEAEQQTRRTGSGMRYPFRSVLDVYTYVSTHPDLSRRGRAKADDDWAVTAFLMAAQGAAFPAGGLSADSAASMPIPRN